MSKGYKEVKPFIDFSAISAGNKNLSDIMKIQQDAQKQNNSKETTNDDEIVKQSVSHQAEQQPVRKQVIIMEPEDEEESEEQIQEQQIPQKPTQGVNIQKESQQNSVKQIPVQLKPQTSQPIIKYQNQSPVLKPENKSQQISNSLHKEAEKLKQPASAPEYKITQFQLREETTPQQKLSQRNDENIFQQELYNKLMLYLEEEGLNELLTQLRNSEQKICITVILDYILNQLEVAKEQEVYLKQHIKENYQTITDLQHKLYDSNERIEAIAAKSESLKLSKLSQESNQNSIERQQKIGNTNPNTRYYKILKQLVKQKMVQFL